MRHPASRAVEPKIPLMFKFYSRSLCRRFYGNPELHSARIGSQTIAGVGVVRHRSLRLLR